MLDRRTLLASGLAAALNARAAAAASSKCGGTRRPNILFIAMDDMNDWIGCLQTNAQVVTPNIDRLAGRGTLFANAHAQAPICNPSRSSLLLGLRPSTTGIYALAPDMRKNPGTAGAISLPQYLSAQGYRTLGAGKIFHYFPAEQLKNEFQEIGPETHVVPRDTKIQSAEGLEKMSWIDWGPDEHAGSIASDQAIAEWGVSKLKSLSGSADDRPFFLAIGFHLPHVPLYVPEKWFDLYPDEDAIQLPPAPPGDLDDVPKLARYLHWKIPEPTLAWLQENGQWRSLVRAYLAAISFTDAQVGRVLDELKSSGLEDDTIVVLWSDHGWHLGEKELTGKTTLWERSTHVPLIFAGPGIAAGGRVKRAVELLDIYPTLVEMAGLPRRAELEGLTLTPLLKDDMAPRARPAISTYNMGNHAIRTERWRYIRYVDGTEELYDHERDPYEWVNLAAKPDHAGTIRDLRKWLPARNAAPAPGSAYRFLEYRDGAWVWEGKAIPEPVDP